MNDLVTHGPTLRDIEQSISGLLEILEDPNITEEERGTAQQELSRWVGEEVGKVDRVRGFLRHCRIMKDIAEQEAKDIAARAKIWEDRRRRLSEICMMVMDERGVKRLEGATGVLRIQTNGGQQKLNVAQPELVPDEFRVYRLSLSIQDAETISRALADSGAVECLRRVYNMYPEIDELKVRDALENGEAVPGAYLDPRGEHLRVA